MSPATHLFLGWLTAHTTELDRRERMLVTLSGILPDLDGLVIIGDYAMGNSHSQLELWSKYHHVLGHNITVAVLAAGISSLIAKKKKAVTALLVFISFHLHLLGDLIGSRGPDGYQWPIPYLLPFSNTWQWTWQGQWTLNAWPNFLITAVSLALILYLAWEKGRSPLEIISQKADNIFVTTLRNRFGKPAEAEERV
jgi:inner membrane protein